MVCSKIEGTVNIGLDEKSVLAGKPQIKFRNGARQQETKNVVVGANIKEKKKKKRNLVMDIFGEKARKKSK